MVIQKKYDYLLKVTGSIQSSVGDLWHFGATPDPRIRIRIQILQALFQYAQHLYDKRKGSGSVPLTNGSGSGSGRPRNMRILRIWISNTASKRPRSRRYQAMCVIIRIWVIYLSSIFHLFLGHCQGFVVLPLLKDKKNGIYILHCGGVV
jgi:hypothetical protein